MSTCDIHVQTSAVDIASFFFSASLSFLCIDNSFLKKLIPKTKSNASMGKGSMPPLPLNAVSPCHYQRYTKRQVCVDPSQCFVHF